jgi:peptidoglycan/xylan/chitin deacetylase (PgdA/CDA1 family)
MLMLVALLCARAWASADEAVDRVAVVLSFDMDAETVWWSDPEAMTGNPSSLAQGRYGPNVALPGILDVLDRHGVRATFFIPSWVIDHYPDAVRSIVAAGHEVGAHGVRHESPVTLTPDQEQAVLDESISVIERATGRRPQGYRAPSWAFSDITMDLVIDAGFAYSSNFMDADQPYVHADSNGLVELPISWILDDAPYFWFDEDTWNKKIHSAADVEAIWQEEFEAIYDSGGYFGLTMHPQIIGRPGRLRMLDRLIGWMQGHSGVQFVTGADMAAQIRGE